MQVDKPADDHMLYISDDLSDSACPSSAEKSSSRTSRSSSIGAKNTSMWQFSIVYRSEVRISYALTYGLGEIRFKALAGTLKRIFH